MNIKWLRMLAFPLVGIAMTACSSYTQINRDQLRYEKMTRGTESYTITGTDSLEAAKDRSAAAVDTYVRHIQAYADIQTTRKLAESRGMQLSAILSKCDSKSRTELNSRMRPSAGPPGTSGGVNEYCPGSIEETAATKLSLSDAKREVSDIEGLWPKSVEDVFRTPKTITTIKKKNGDVETRVEEHPSQEITKKEEKNGTVTTETRNPYVMPDSLIRALSSTSSVSQMRDLLTEPNFPEMLPTERKVNLGCLPPPDSAAFEAVTKLTADLERNSVGKLGLSSEYADRVVKLFEESERSLFLQYALFRLCEVSINSPSGLRNVIPVIMHDMVRRTAEMGEVATREAEQRRIEEAKLKAKETELKLAEAEGKNEAEKVQTARQLAYLNCLSVKKDGSGIQYSDEVVAQCKKATGLTSEEEK